MSVFSKIFKLIAHFFKLRNTTHPVAAIAALREIKKVKSTDDNSNAQLRTSLAAENSTVLLKVADTIKRDEESRKRAYSSLPNLAKGTDQSTDTDISYQFENNPYTFPADTHKDVCDDQQDTSTRKALYARRVFMQHVYGSVGYEKLALRNWLVQKFLPAAAVGILVGASQAFKTFIALYIALCITNQRLFGRFRTQQGLVFIAVGEGVSGITTRLKALEERYGSVGTKIVIFPEPYNLQNPEEAQHIANVIREESTRQELPATMLILDTLSQNAAGIRENDSAAMSSYLRACADFARDNNITVLNVHHEGKSGQMRGSSTLLCNVDFVLNAKRVAGEKYETILSIDKMKDGSSEHKMMFQLNN